jgi:predicted RNA-binding Zn ribbon-like protein
MSPSSPAIFIADSVALNFLNSIATPVNTEIDWIGDGEGLLTWLEQAQLVPVEALEAIRKHAKPGELDRVAVQARNLREWFRTLLQENMGKPLKAAVLTNLDPLNRLLAKDDAFGQLVAHKRGKTTVLELQRTRHWRSPESLLLPIAEALASTLTEENLSDVKACEGAACTLMFVDRTRARSRRWCSMEICGNRAKQLAHRHRLKELR